MSVQLWFRVVGNIPEVGAYPPDLIMMDGEEVWIFKKVPATWCKPIVYNDRLSVILPTTLPSDVSDPINARSDLAALVELIHSAGGRMPEA